MGPAELESAPFALRLLGPMELTLRGRPVPLPRSKKTRALLAYLAVTGRAHRRDRLCALLWDATDDPRGALRWSLSRLRSALGERGTRICADQEEVALSTTGMAIDAIALARLQSDGFGSAETALLEQAATWYRGEFLEGLHLPDFLDFSAWCIEHREQSRRRHCDLLAELVTRLRDEPERGLPYARQRVQADAFNLHAHRDLLRLLLGLGHREEAQQRHEQSLRLLRQVSAQDAIALDHAWRSMRDAAAGSAAPGSHRAPPASPAGTSHADPAVPVDGGVPAFVGRKRVLSELEASLLAPGKASPRLVLVTGEPGVGKTRLAEQLRHAAEAGGFAAIVGRAFEAEGTRPFGPWADALQLNMQSDVAAGNPASREGVFDLLKARLASLAAQGRGILLVMDDLQWFDRNSAEFLHYLVRTGEGPGVSVLMLARGGELHDNEAVARMLRSMRRGREIIEIELEALTREEIEALVEANAGVDAARVHEFSAGNPLYAIEFVRARRDGVARTPANLLQLVRDRVARLPDRAADVLRWGAVLGHAIDPARLEALMSRPADELVEALERLERACLLRIDVARVRERYVIAHDLIREAVYAELSHPRRRLMHRKVALLLEPLAADPAVAAEIAHHASLAGEASLGVRACICAGHHALRLFANAEAEALARSGLRLAEELGDAERVESTLELLQVLYTARTPDREEAAVRVRGLAERALDLGLARPARQGFQMVSYLRWERSSLADAHANILQAERVSRLAEPGERAVALAQAARCLVLLERNLQQAEAFALEAESVRRREGQRSAAVAFALGMIAAYRGEADAAAEAFVEARALARQQGEHLAEFGALAHHVMLEMDRGGYAHAAALAGELVELARRVRPGAEVHTGQALLELARLHAAASADETALRDAVEAVRQADAKYELSFLLTRWAAHALDAERYDSVRAIAGEAREVAQAAGRSSEVAHALASLAWAAHRERHAGELRKHMDALEPLLAQDLSAVARARVEALRSKVAATRTRREARVGPAA